VKEITTPKKGDANLCGKVKRGTIEPRPRQSLRNKKTERTMEVPESWTGKNHEKRTKKEIHRASETTQLKETTTTKGLARHLREGTRTEKTKQGRE